MNKCKSAKAMAKSVASQCYAKAPAYKLPKRPCECSDPGCPSHHGVPVCNNPGTTRLWRIDMDMPGGTSYRLMCPDCADDAMNSGVFRCTKR